LQRAGVLAQDKARSAGQEAVSACMRWRSRAINWTWTGSRHRG